MLSSFVHSFATGIAGYLAPYIGQEVKNFPSVLLYIIEIARTAHQYGE